MRKLRIQESIVAFILMALPMFAHAHSGGDAGMHHDHGIVEFVTHFVADVDHLLMLAAAGLAIALIYKLRRSA